MKKILVRLTLVVGSIFIIYWVNVLTTNYILFPSNKPVKRLSSSAENKITVGSSEAEKLHQEHDPEQTGAGAGNGVGLGGYIADVRIQTNDDPLFRQDVEKYSFYNSNNQQLLNDDRDTKLLEMATKLRIPYKIVHLDLKGAPPKMSYIVNHVLPMIHSVGANGLLLEYEDTFPFQGGYFSQLSNGIYTMDEIKWLLSEAKKLNFEVIPLVQTFGHMEYVLKKKEFQSLRENPNYPQTICPKQNTSWSLVTQLIDQVMSLHPTSNYIHIGCDEAYQISQCPLCRGTDPKVIFIDHVARVASYIKSKYKKINVIIWDDMLRKYYTNELLQSNIGSLVELMIWDYTEDVERLIPNYLFEMYSTVFPHIWAASAFKGAFGEKLYNVNINRHALNHLSWLKTMSAYQTKIKNFRGFALTGWSRYDHFAILCELLPDSIPSLLLNLLILKHRNVHDSIKALGVELKCDLINIDLPIGYCQWPGDRLYNLLNELESVQNQVTTLTAKTDSNGWFTRWHILNNYTNPARIVGFYNETTNLKAVLEMSRIKIEAELDNFYNKSVADQWLDMVIEPIMFKLNTILRDVHSLSKRVTW